MFAEDLSVFFDVNSGFAVDALRTPVGGILESEVKAVIFDANGLNAQEFDVVTQEPSFIVPTSTWTDLAADDEFAIDGANYRARQVHKWRDGALTLVVVARLQ